DMVLLDVTPITLGIETLGGVVTPIIERNTTIPVKKSKVFSTAADMQPAVTVHVLQGERPMAGDNTSLGEFNLVGIPPAPRGVPQIEVTFDIDSSGILHVSAKDRGTGKEQKITITASTKLADSEIEKMVKQAEEHGEEDRKRKELIESKNELDSMVYQTEKLNSEAGDKIPGGERSKVEAALKSAKEALKGDDLEKIKAELDKLKEALQAAGSSIYQAAAQEQQATRQTQAGEGEGSNEAGKGKNKARKAEEGKEPGDEKVVDADFRMEGEDKNKSEK
ncbi:MAG: Hsp70 family protein, partial [Candidatus Aenigmatarchaeota archaeon]